MGRACAHELPQMWGLSGAGGAVGPVERVASEGPGTSVGPGRAHGMNFANGWAWTTNGQSLGNAILYTSRPLYGCGLEVGVHFVCVYIVLRFAALLWCLSTSFSSPWVDFAFLLEPSGQRLDHFGATWVAMESPWSAWGNIVDFFNKTGRPDSSKWLSSTNANKKWPPRTIPRLN